MNDDLSFYHESEDPLTFLLALPPPPLGMIGNPIVISDDEDDIDSPLSCPSYHEARSMFTTPMLQLLHCQDCTINTTFTLTALNISATIALCMPLIIANSAAQTIEAGDFNLSGG
jgi:hypothetical protein